MAKLGFFVVAEGISVDQATNRISLFNVIEEVYPPSFPASIPTVVAICLWNAEPGDEDQDFQLTLRITPPGQPPKEFHQNFRIPGWRCRTLSFVEGMQVAHPGELRLDADLNGKHQASHVIYVCKAETDDLPAAANS